ncbi:hypothetical protein NLJ89_g1236 [Agrocybe chaxingu]|uniref:Asl1-like glycosyl hydrolase catalytic domain-containing protein n=1 Tax=Agrocybe chaxingu TaxID=84603 RepID=A0A9W8N0G3_9AGAR|nr:hypothetical protein NLJ89_g1236 [Agrocybe chaxingu]
MFVRDIINANQSDSLISWQYNWGDLPPAYLATSNIKYIPMQWGSVGIDNFAEDVKMQGADTILAFNEPDYVNEANMDPVGAAHLWIQYIEPLKSLGIRLGLSELHHDFLPLHWYGTGVEGFYGYIWDVHNNFPRYPIWITEYGDTSTNDTEVLNFLNQTVTYLDTLDWIERYAWFGYFRPRPDAHYNLLREDGGLNALGELYIGAKTVHTQNVTEPPSTLRTVNGADNPTQAPASTWAPYPSSSHTLGGWKLQLTTAAMTLLSCCLGVLSVTL